MLCLNGRPLPLSHWNPAHHGQIGRGKSYFYRQKEKVSHNHRLLYALILARRGKFPLGSLLHRILRVLGKRRASRSISVGADTHYLQSNHRY
jgi:hypothetical protein